MAETAVALVCKDRFPDCTCEWCYKVSSNGFHMKNQGQCTCWADNCPCINGGNRTTPVPEDVSATDMLRDFKDNGLD